jgi:FSR family fosmidomycin resistance protein-like MFS transporter
MLVCGAIGTAAGGPLGDRFNRRAIVIITLIGLAISGAALTWAGTHHQLALAFLFIALTGALTSMSGGITAVMGQDYLPARIGTASGVTLGLSISLGGVAAPILGALADHYGLAVAIGAVSVVAILSLACAVVLPAPAITRRAASAQAGEAQPGQRGEGDDADARREVEAANEAVPHGNAQHAPAVGSSS